MKEKVVSGMQNFARSMIGPVLYLPIIGLVVALAAVMTNTAFVTENGMIWTAGRFFNGMLNPLMGNLSILFCVGIATGMAKKKKTDAAFLALLTYIAFLGANSRWLELAGRMAEGMTAGDLYGTGQTIQLGFHVTDMGVFLGMILGVIVAQIHNRYIGTEFKGAMAPYGNSKFVFLLLIPVVGALSVAVTYIWPTIAAGITALTGFMSTAGAIGVFVYGFLNRFLIPTGLHHLIWSPFVFSSLGDQMVIGGENISGAKPVFLALLSDPTVTQMPDSARFLAYGLVKTFGVIGVALAFYYTAKKNKKKNLKAQLIPSTATAVVAGITEPLEFTFIFAAPVLWFVYSVIDGLFQMYAYILDVRVCMTNGLLDLIVLNIPAGAERTRWPLFVLLGLIEIVVIFVVFKFMIEKLNLKTPGREDDDSDDAIDLHENASEVKKKLKPGKTEEIVQDEERARKIITALGGKSNLESVENCFTRLRVNVRDDTVIDEEALKETGAAGVVRKGKNIQVIYGTSVNKVRTIVDDALETME